MSVLSAFHVIEVVSTTRGSDGAERLTFEGGHVDSDGMRDITDQVQFFDAPNPPTVVGTQTPGLGPYTRPTTLALLGAATLVLWYTSMPEH